MPTPQHARHATVETPRLIVVDGFAGSGKSTTAQRVWLHLVRRGRDARWFQEHEAGHPIFEYGEVEDLLQQTPDVLEARVLAGWQACVDGIASTEVVIVEGSFLQIPIGVMVSMNAPIQRIRSFVRRIDAIANAAGLGTTLVYLARPDVQAALTRVGTVRGQHWLASITDTLAQSAYGRQHRVRSLAGLTRFYERQHQIVETLLPRLTMRRITVDVSNQMWSRHDRDVAAFLKIRRSPEPRVDSADLLRHTGTYRSASGAPGVVTTDGKRLYLQLPATRAMPLLPIGDGHYCAESLPIDVRFAYHADGRARRLDYDSRMVNEVLTESTWVRTR